MTTPSAPPNRYPEHLVGVPQHAGAFAPPFIFPSKNQQKLLINAGAYAESALTTAQVGSNPTPYLNDAMNGFSNPNIQPPFTQSAKPKELEMPMVGMVQQLTTPQKGLMSGVRQGLAEEQIMKAASVNNSLRKNNVIGAEMVLGRHLTIEEISNKTITPNIRYTQGGQPVPVEFTPLKTVIGVGEKFTPDPVTGKHHPWGNWNTGPNVLVPNGFSEDTEQLPNTQLAQASGAAPGGFASDAMAADPDEVLIPQAPMFAPDAPPLTSQVAAVPTAPAMGMRLVNAQLARHKVNARDAITAADIAAIPPDPRSALLADIAGSANRLRPAPPRPMAPSVQQPSGLGDVLRQAMKGRLIRLEEQPAPMRDVEEWGEGVQSTEHFKQHYDGSDLSVTGNGQLWRNPRSGDVARSGKDLHQAKMESKREESRRILQAIKEDAVLGGRHRIGAHEDDVAKDALEGLTIAKARSRARASVKNVELQHAPEEFKMDPNDDDGLGDLPPRSTNDIVRPPKFQNGQNDVTMSGGMLGKFRIHLKKLHGGVVSLSYPNGKKVPGYPNAEVGPELQNQILAMVSGIAPKKHKLTGGEVDFIDNLVKRANIQFASRGKRNAAMAKQTVKTNKTMRQGVKTVGRQNTTPLRQAQIVLGEIKAGNNSALLKLKLRSLIAKHGNELPDDLLVIIHQALLHNHRK